jgi:hypothetical protein
MSTEKKSTEKLDDLKAREAREAEAVKGGLGPIDGKRPPTGTPKPLGPIDG